MSNTEHTKRIIHCADLHLSLNEKDYSFKVLEEIISITKNKKADFLIFSGDIFDSFPDAESLRIDFRKIITLLQDKCTILMIPGNHENIRRHKNRQLNNLDFGRLQILEKKPFDLVKYNDIEFLIIPHQADYKFYMQWPVPKKSTKFRIALAHGVVSGMSYTGFDEESGASVLDTDMFTRFNVDYAALGHIHSLKTQKIGSLYINYPGSARVWRKGEIGPRFIYYIELNKDIQATPLTLSTAGEYRFYKWPLSLEGKFNHNDTASVALNWKKEDWIDIHFSGIVEHEKIAIKLKEHLKDKYSKLVRKLEINRDDISILEGISSQPIAQKFLELWEAKKPCQGNHWEWETAVWLKAREKALSKIKEMLEARR